MSRYFPVFLSLNGLRISIGTLRGSVVYLTEKGKARVCRRALVYHVMETDLIVGFNGYMSNKYSMKKQVC